MKSKLLIIPALLISFTAGTLTSSFFTQTMKPIPSPVCYYDELTEIWCELGGLHLIYNNRHSENQLRELSIGLTPDGVKTLSVADLDNDGQFDSLSYMFSHQNFEGTITDTNLDGSYDYIYSIYGNDKIKIDSNWTDVKEKDSTHIVVVNDEPKHISFAEHPYRYTIEGNGESTSREKINIDKVESDIYRLE